MLTRRKIFSACVLAYLLVGSGRYAPSMISRHDAAQREAQAFASTLPRKVYRYSVVPGGVYTSEELRMARRNDPVVALHFADFGANTHVTRLPEDMYVYISYRKGDKIYYSKKKHKVCKGEMVITDGKNYARTRCANRLSKVFRPPAVAFDEPAAPEFDYIDAPGPPETVPTDPLLTSNYYGLPGGPGYNPPQTTTGANPGPSLPYAGTPTSPILPAMIPFAGNSPGLLPPITGRTTPIPPVTAVPEPAEWLLMPPSAMAVLYLRRRQKRAT